MIIIRLILRLVTLILGFIWYMFCFMILLPVTSILVLIVLVGEFLIKGDVDFEYLDKLLDWNQDITLNVSDWYVEFMRKYKLI
jgi:hypothetical protein